MDFSNLFAFAKHTRQSEDEMRDVTKLAQKWLAVHTAPLVYAQIAGDYALLALRTHSPPLQSYALSGFDVPTFVAVLKTGLESNEPIDADAVGPAFAQFCAALFPTPAAEEKWEKYTRRDHWKRAGYFLAAQRPTQFYPLAQAVYFSDIAQSQATRAQLDDMADLATRITRYTAQHMQSVSPKELGNLIALVQMPTVVVINQPAAVPSSSAAEVGSDAEDDYQQHYQQNVEGFCIHFGSSPVPIEQQQLVGLATAVKDYRIGAGLNVTVSTARLAKQMVLSALGLCGKEPECEVLLTKHQEVFTPVQREQTDWEKVVTLATTGDPTPHLVLSDPALNDFCHAKPSDNARDFLRDVVRFRLGQEVEGIDSRFKKRHLKMYPNVPESVIKAIILS
jgi:hypothetical protein